MALDRYQILGAYEYLEEVYNDIMNEDNPRKQHCKIEDYSSQLFRIESNMKIIKQFINSTYETEFKDAAAKLYNNYTGLLMKLYYCIRHKEDKVLRDVVDSCDVVVFK